MTSEHVSETVSYYYGELEDGDYFYIGQSYDDEDMSECVMMTRKTALELADIIKKILD